MTTDDRPTFIHDTRHIIRVNQAACDLFRCEAVALTDRAMLDLIPDEMGRGLAKLRLQTMRDTGKIPGYDIVYPFLRFDGTVFLASLVTRKLEVDEQFETILIYKGEE